MCEPVSLDPIISTSYLLIRYSLAREMQLGFVWFQLMPVNVDVMLLLTSLTIELNREIISS